MNNDIRISRVQLAFLMMGLILGNHTIINPTAFALQDAWLAFLLSWGGGFIIITVYVYIAFLYPGKTLIEILQSVFGRVLGGGITLFYLLYFILVIAEVIRNFGGYMITTTYPETPLVVLIGIFALVGTYAVIKGIEVIARISELFVPIIITIAFALSLLVLREYEFKRLLPFMEQGISPVLKASLNNFAFSFGGTVTFLMFFPTVNEKKGLLKTSYWSLFFVGLLLLNMTLRDLLVLGPDMFSRILFPPSVTSELIPDIQIDPIISVNLLIGGGIKFSLSLYATATGISQLFHLDDYKPFVLPLTVLCIALALWAFENILEMWLFINDFWAIFSFPFQIAIPILIVVVSWAKSKIAPNQG